MFNSKVSFTNCIQLKLEVANLHVCTGFDINDYCQNLHREAIAKLVKSENGSISGFVKIN